MRKKSELKVQEELVHRAQSGDRKAFEALILQSYTRVFEVARQFKLDSDAEDLLQETAIKVWRALPHYRNQGFATWLRVIAIRTAIDFVRRKKRSCMSLGAEPADACLDQIVDGRGASADEVAARHEAIERLRFFFEKEAKAHERLVLLSLLEEFTVAELAEMLEISLPTAYVRKASLLRKLTARFFTREPRS